MDSFVERIGIDGMKKGIFNQFLLALARRHGGRGKNSQEVAIGYVQGADVRIRESDSSHCALAS
jgi:hypothetical protein